MHPCVFVFFSFLFLNTATANQLAAAGGGGDDNGVMNKCLDKERHALLQFKSQVQDPHGILSSWTAEEDDCCIWFGVTCNTQTGHVTELEIREYGLVGKIAQSFLNLSHLNHLDLSDNLFHGTIPIFIGSMTHLRYLDLSFNNLNGTIPTIIGSLTKLEYLSLANNSLSGTIPTEFGNLTKLQTLSLRDVGRCRVDNLQWLSHLSHLEELEMDGISLAKADYWVDVILSLRKLSYLSLWGCELSQVLYPYSSFVNPSSSIESLYLGNNNLTSSMYHWLFPLTSNKLRYLYLAYNMLDGIPTYLGNLCSLESLSFSYNTVAVRFPDFLSNLSGCTSLTLQTLYAPKSQFTGSLSDDIQKFSSLGYLDLSYNHLNGTISEKLWELPWLQTIDVSFNYLRGAISKNIGKSMTSIIDLSENSLEGVLSTNHMSNISYVTYIDLSFCKRLGPGFPKWIQTLKNLSSLSIANSRISDTVPLEFWDTWPSQLQYLNLSFNNITGNVPNLSSNFDTNSIIDLSSNNFHGPIPSVSSNVTSLNLSRNNFSGGLFFLCETAHSLLQYSLLQYVDLSDNFLSGQFPDCLRNFPVLKVLNLGNNNLSGSLPPSIGSFTGLEALYLYKNGFSGELPSSLKNCTFLNSLNLGSNKFSGNVPVWIGQNLPRLYILILRSNNLLGTIPLQLCELANLQILDLSRNHLHGSIPSCLNNLTSMVQGGFLPTKTEHSFSLPYYKHGSRSYVDHAMVEWQGAEREFIRSNLVLLKSIDLSSNNLTGEIPSELANLYELVNLNLSKNALLGTIPSQIGQMKNLLALDLSRNNLTGEIPSSMSQISLLSYLDVSYNNLSGRIPSSTQLQSFQPSRYDGNFGLCGLPLSKECPGDEESEAPPAGGKREGDGKDTDEDWGWFYIGGETGFVTGFWIVCGALLLNRRGRRAFFHFYDSFKDWVYVKVLVSIANFKRVTRTYIVI